MAESKFQYHPLDPKRPTPWRGTCRDCGRGIDVGEESEVSDPLCGLCANVRDIQERMVDREQRADNAQAEILAILKNLQAEIALLKRVLAPHATRAD